MSENEYINNLSYTNKDFASIYRELLQIVPKVTAKWNPQNSNESDPGVVLLKLMSVLGDKLNYNVDKNILEAFPQSVTQLSNARHLYGSLGYNMHWYKSATTRISIKYSGNEIDNGKISSIQLPLFTMVTNDDGSSVYTLLGDTCISQPIFIDSTNILSIDAIEGTINQLNIGGNTDITLSNLDDDNRIYFPQTRIAQNGVFICNIGENNFNEWSASQNIESSALSSHVYQFGTTPDGSSCYIQFPQNIANIINNGLNIYYIVSQGGKGNISANTLNKFYGNIEITTSDNSTLNVTDDFIINNAAAAVNGEDPEEIDDAYRNYKKIVGTFDTLVSCRDYENALYNNPSIVSNAVVSDRTNDINNSTHIVTFDGNETVDTLVADDSVMNAFQLGIYGLYPMSDVYSVDNFNKSFTSTALSNTAFTELLEGYKYCQHDFIDTRSEALPLYLLKNFFILTGKVTTNYKVGSVEAEDIEQNIRTALYTNFNAHNMEFGIEPQYQDIVDVVKNADSRIRDVIINEPEYILRKLLVSDTVGSFATSAALSDSDLTRMCAKLVLNGSVQLYKFDNNFSYQYGQLDAAVYSNIHSITTGLTIPNNYEYSSDCLSKGYLLKENENVQILSPSLITERTFSAYTNYKFTLNSEDSIPANTVYELKAGEKLEIEYIDTNNVKQTPLNNENCLYTQGDIFSCSVDVSNSGKYKTLAAADTINIKKINQQTIDSSWGDYLYCYWITNEKEDGKSVLFHSGQTTRVLDNNEYFIYADSTRSNIVLLGSGTTLTRSVSTSYPIVMISNISTSQIRESGIAAFGSYDWYLWRVNTDPLKITENEITSLGSGTYIKMDVADGEGVAITQPPLLGAVVTIDKDRFRVIVNGTRGHYKFSYSAKSSHWTVQKPVGRIEIVTLSDYGISVDSAADAETFTVEYGGLDNTSLSNVSNISYGTSLTNLKPISELSLTSYSRQALCRLNLNASKSVQQDLVDLQTIELTYGDAEPFNTVTLSGSAKQSILFNENLFLAGGNNIDAAVTSYTGKTEYSLCAYVFTDTPIDSKIVNSGSDITIPAASVYYSLGDSYDAAMDIPAGSYTVGIDIPYKALSLNGTYVNAGQEFTSDFDIQYGTHTITSSSDRLTLKQAVLPFIFRYPDNYIIPVLKTGSDATFTITTDSANVFLDAIVPDGQTADSNSNQVKSAGMYYLRVTYPSDLPEGAEASRIFIEADNTLNQTDFLRIYNPVKLSSHFWGDAFTGNDETASKQNLGAVEKAICGHIIYGSSSTPTQSDRLDSEGKFCYTYQVPEEDLIKSARPLSAEALWDTNNIYNRYTIAQLDTADSNITVSYSSKLSSR